MVDAAIKRVEDAKATLQRAMEKNSRMKGIQEAQAIIINKLEASLEVVEQEVKEVESDTESRIKAISSKAMKDFQASTKFLDVKADFAYIAYGEGVKFA